MKTNHSMMRTSLTMTLTGMSLIAALGSATVSPALAAGGVSTANVHAAPAATAAPSVLSPSVVTKVAVDESTYDVNKNGHLDLNETAGLKIDFTFPENVKPGDSFTVGVQSPFKFALSSNGVSVRNTEGVVIATVYPDGDDSRTVRFTAAEGVSNLDDVVGTATIPFASAATPTGDKVAFTYSINGGEMRDSGTLIAPQKGRAGSSSAIVYPSGTNDGTVGVSVVAFGTPTGSAVKNRPITITFTPDSDNWKFDAALKKKFDSGQAKIDASYSDDGTQVARKYVHVVSSAPDKVVVRVDNVDPLRPLRVQLPESAGLGTNDGKDLRVIAVVEGEGVQRAGIELKASAHQPVADGSGTGVVPPKAVDDTATTFSGKPVDIKPMANDSAQQSGATLKNVKLFVNGKESTSYTVEGQGTFTVKDDSTITFTPVDGFFGESTPVSYKVFDSQGKAAIANITVTVNANAPKATPDKGSGGFCDNVVVDPLANDSLGNTGDTWKAVDLLDASGKPVKKLVTDKGTYTVVDGNKIEFVPKDCAFGTMPAVSYRATDSHNSTADSTVTVVLAAPLKPKAAADTTQGSNCDETTVDVLANDTLGNKGDTWSKVELLDSNGKPVSRLETDKGVFTVKDNKIVFTPAEECAFGEIPKVSYRATDSHNNTADSTVTISTPQRPQAAADEKDADNCDETTVDVLANDTLGNKGDTWTKVELLDSNGKPVSELVTDKGVFTVKDNKIVFTPSDECVFGQLPSINYRATDSNGNTADSSVKMRASEKPGAAADEKDADNCDETTIDVLANDTLGNDGDRWAKVELLDSNGKPVDRLETDKGVFTVKDNKIVFTPADGCAFGEVPKVSYRATDSNGNSANSTVTLRTPERPQAAPDEKDAANCDETTVDVLANDSLGNDGDTWTKVELLDSNGKPVDRLETDKGVFTVKDNKIVFTPSDGCAFGEVPKVSYRATDSNGNTAQSDVVLTTPESPKASADEVDGSNCDETTVDVLANDTLGNDGDTWTKVELLDKDGKPVERLETDKGVFTVKDNKIVFTPADGCAFGEVPQVSYRATDSNKNAVDSTVKIATPESPKAESDTKDGSNCDETEVDVLANDTLGNDGDTWTKVELLDKDGKPVDRLETDKGVFTVKDNKIVFAPSKGCVFGGIPEVSYRATDSHNNTAESTVRISTPESPRAAVDEKDVDNCDHTTIDVLANDTLGNDGDTWTKVELLDKDGKPVSKVETTNGVFIVEGNKIVFIPSDSCVYGDIPQVSYRVTDSHNNTAESTVIAKAPSKPEPTATASPTDEPTDEPSPSPSDEPSPTVSDEPTATPSSEPTSSPSATEQPSASPSPSAHSTTAPQPTPEATPEKSASAEPSVTSQPSSAPTKAKDKATQPASESPRPDSGTTAPSAPETTPVAPQGVAKDVPAPQQVGAGNEASEDDTSTHDTNRMMLWIAVVASVLGSLTVLGIAWCAEKFYSRTKPRTDDSDNEKGIANGA